MYLNEATLLNNVRVRYNKDHIYVGFLLFLCVSARASAKLRYYSVLVHLKEMSVRSPHRQCKNRLEGKGGTRSLHL